MKLLERWFATLVRVILLEVPGEERVDKTNGIEIISDDEEVEVVLVRLEVLEDNLEES